MKFICHRMPSLVPHGQPVTVLTQLRDHIVLCLEGEILPLIISSVIHLVDDSVRREVILVEGAVKTHGGDVARADKGTDAGALLENNMVTITL